MKKRLLDFLDSAKDMRAEARELELELFLRKWQGAQIQTDDILLIGLNPFELNNNHLKKINKEN